MITIAHGMSRQIIANLSVMSVKLSWRSNPVRRSLESSVTLGLGGVLNLPSPHACLGELLGRGVANAAVRTNIPPNDSNSPAVAMIARANTLTLLFYPQQLSSSIFMPCAAMLVYRIMPLGYNSREDIFTSSHLVPSKCSVIHSLFRLVFGWFFYSVRSRTGWSGLCFLCFVLFCLVKSIGAREITSHSNLG